MDESAFRAVSLCQVLGSTTRYRILKLLAKGQMRPGDLCEALDKPSPVISVHLAKLRAAGLVRYKRKPEGLFYWPKPGGPAALLRRLEEFVSSLTY